MKIQVTQAFHGRPDEAAGETTLYLAGAIFDAPDEFAKMVIAKGLAKPVALHPPVKKDKPNENE